MATKRWHKVLSGTLAGVLVLVGCGDDDDAGGDGEPWELVLSTGLEPTNLDPVHELNGAAMQFTHNIFEPLVRFNSDGSEIEPILAEEVPERVEDTVWEVHLREDVLFHDQSTFDAADVVYTMEWILEEAHESQLLGQLPLVESVEAVDDLTVRFTTSAPDPILDRRLTLVVIRHEGFDQDPDYPMNLNGTGPYTLVSHTPAVDTVIEKNPDYWGENDGPDRMVSRVIPEIAVRMAALQNGEIDMVLALTPDQADEAPKVASVQSPKINFIRANTLSGVMSDPLLREAVFHAIDRETLVTQLFGEFGTVASCQFAAPTVFGHDDSLDPIEHDPDRARDLVEEADYDGTTIDLAAIAARFPEHQDVAETIAQDLRDVGFEVETSYPVPPESTAALLEPPNFPALLVFGSNTETFENLRQKTWFQPDQIFAANDNETIDDLVIEAESELDEDRREELLFEINQILCEEYILIPLYYRDELFGVSDDLDWQPRADEYILLSEMRRG